MLEPYPSSGLNDVTAPLALAAGARGVGIGSMISRLPNTVQVNKYLTMYGLEILKLPQFNNLF